MRRLVLAAHGDDEVIGAGGTMCHHARHGDQVTVGVLTVDADQAAVATRRAEAIEAWRRSGVCDGDFAGLRSHPLTVSDAAVDAVCGWLERWRPEVVYVPHQNEADPDHHVMAAIAVSALLRSANDALLLGYEVWTPLAAYHVVQDITALAETKRLAIGAYRSQLEACAWDEAVLGLNRYRGATTGRGRWCEVFAVVPR